MGENKNIEFSNQFDFVDYLSYYGSDFVKKSEFFDWYVREMEICYINFTVKYCTQDILFRDLKNNFAIFLCPFFRGNNSPTKHISLNSDNNSIDSFSDNN